MYARRRWCPAIPVLSAAAALVLMAHGATIKFDQSQTGDYNLQIHLKNIELYAVFDDSGGSDDEYGDLPDYTDVTDAPSKPPAAGPAPSSTTAAPPYPSSSSSSTSPPPPPPPPSSSTSTGSSAVAASPPAAAVSSSATAASSAAALLDPYSASNNDKIVQMVEALIASNGNASDMPAAEPPAAAVAPQPQPQPQSSAPPQQLQQSSGQSPPAAVALAAASASSTANRKCGPGYFRDPMGRCRRIRKPHLPFLQMVHTPGVIKSFQPQLRTTEDDTSKN